MIKFLLDIMAVDSTSGKENSVAQYIKENVKVEGAELEVQEISNGKINLFYSWGKPKIIFCSHFDTVPPYIPPREEDNVIYGRGSCDAKGQLACMYEVCRQLHNEGDSNFGLLMLAGEEVGSYGAERANELITGCEYVIVGEPTENKLIKAGKGNMLVKLQFRGTSCHSGYPENGDNAIDRMTGFLDKLKAVQFPQDPLLGDTIWNIGELKSDNAHNVVSDNTSMKIFFRTTFETHGIMEEKLRSIIDDKTIMEIAYDDAPIRFHTVEGLETGIVSYGSDAPDLFNLGKPLLYGPGSILNAHTEKEHILVEEMERAVRDLRMIYGKLKQEAG